MQFLGLQVFAGMFLNAIGLSFRFAQVLRRLIYIGFQLLPQSLKWHRQVQICYNFYDSRKCTLKTKYDIVLKRGRLQKL